MNPSKQELSQHILDSDLLRHDGVEHGDFVPDRTRWT